MVLFVKDMLVVTNVPHNRDIRFSFAGVQLDKIRLIVDVSLALSCDSTCCHAGTSPCNRLLLMTVKLAIFRIHPQCRKYSSGRYDFSELLTVSEDSSV